MAVDTTGLMTCTYGSAGFVLEKTSYQESPSIVDGSGRTITRATFTGSGFFDADSIASFNTKLAAIIAALRTDGQTFQVIEFGDNVTFSLPAGSCLDGTPICDFKITDGVSALHKKIDFT